MAQQTTLLSWKRQPTLHGTAPALSRSASARFPSSSHHRKRRKVEAAVASPVASLPPDQVPPDRGNASIPKDVLVECMRLPLVGNADVRYALQRWLQFLLLAAPGTCALQAGLATKYGRMTLPRSRGARGSMVLACPCVCVLQGRSGSGKSHLLRAAVAALGSAKAPSIITLDGASEDLAPRLRHEMNAADGQRTLVVLDAWGAVAGTQRGAVLDVLRAGVAATRASSDAFARNPVLIMADEGDVAYNTGLAKFAAQGAYHLRLAPLNDDELLAIVRNANSAVFHGAYTLQQCKDLVLLGNPRLALNQMRFLQLASTSSTPTPKRAMLRIAAGIPASMSSFETAEACLRIMALPQHLRLFRHRSVQGALRAAGSDNTAFLVTLLQLGLPHTAAALVPAFQAQPRVASGHRNPFASAVHAMSGALDALCDFDIAFHSHALRTDTALACFVAPALLQPEVPVALPPAAHRQWPLRPPLPGAYFPSKTAHAKRGRLLAAQRLGRVRRHDAHGADAKEWYPWRIPATRSVTSRELADYTTLPKQLAGAHPLLQGVVA